MTNEEWIAGYREKQDRARNAVRQIDEGRVQHLDHDSYPAEDVTAEWRDTLQQKADTMERLILASESEQKNAGAGE